MLSVITSFTACVVGRRFQPKADCSDGEAVSILHEAGNPRDRNALLVVGSHDQVRLLLGRHRLDITWQILLHATRCYHVCNSADLNNPLARGVGRHRLMANCTQFAVCTFCFSAAF